MKKNILILVLLLFLTSISGCIYYPTKNEEPVERVFEINGIKIENITKDKGLYSHPRWSPDGKKLAFYFEDKIYVKNDGEDEWIQVALFTDSDVVHVTPLSWGSSNQIYYEESDLDTSKRPIVYGKRRIGVIDLPHGERDILVRDLSGTHGLSANPHNSSMLLFGSHSPDKKKVIIYLYDLKHKTKKELTEGNDPRWAPDGNRFCFTRKDGVYVYEFKKGKIKQVYKNKMVRTSVRLVMEAADFPCWSPDGRWIVYRLGPSYMSEPKAKLHGLYIVPSDGSGQSEELLDFYVGHFDWSYRKDRIAFTNIGAPGRRELYLMDVPEKYRSGGE